MRICRNAVSKARIAIMAPQEAFDLDLAANFSTI
jgi:hypothetical protein